MAGDTLGSVGVREGLWGSRDQRRVGARTVEKLGGEGAEEERRKVR